MVHDHQEWITPREVKALAALYCQMLCRNSLEYLSLIFKKLIKQVVDLEEVVIQLFLVNSMYQILDEFEKMK